MTRSVKEKKSILQKSCLTGAGKDERRKMSEISYTTKYNTTEEIKEYYEECVKFWIRQGDCKAVAMAKALWWDCIEIWNATKSWNDDKVNFVNQYRKYTPYDPIPEGIAIEKGA